MTIVFQILEQRLTHTIEDTITVQVASGDPNGMADEFAEHLRQSLVEWYDDETAVKVQQVIE